MRKNTPSESDCWRKKHNKIVLVLLAFLLHNALVSAETLTLPPDLKEIHEEAFFGVSADFLEVSDSVTYIADKELNQEVANDP